MQAQQHQKNVFEANKEIADENALRDYAALQDRQLQEQAKAGEAIRSSSAGAREASATARASAGAAGVAGASVEGLLADFERAELGHRRSVVRNQEFLATQFQREGEAVRSGQRAQILSAMPGPAPDYLGMALNTYGNVLKINYNKKHGYPLT
jgi:hypothetical protein